MGRLWDYPIPEMKVGDELKIYKTKQRTQVYLTHAINALGYKFEINSRKNSCEYYKDEDGRQYTLITRIA